MKGLRSAVFAMLFVFVMMLGIGILGWLGRMVSAGRLRADTLIAGITLFTLLLVIVIIALVIKAVKAHRAHLSQASSKDILAEIIAMGNDARKAEGEENEESKE